MTERNARCGHLVLLAVVAITAAACGTTEEPVASPATAPPSVSGESLLDPAVATPGVAEPGQNEPSTTSQGTAGASTGKATIATECGGPTACYDKAMALVAGDGGVADQVTGRHFAELSCKAGSIRGCGAYGYLLYAGIGGHTDPVKGLELSKSACGPTTVGACRNTAAMLFEGKGIQKSPKEALEFAKQACDGGDAKGCHLAGVIMEGSSEIPLVTKDLHAYYDAACEGGYGPACSKMYMVVRYAKAPETRAEARSYLVKGCAAADGTSCLDYANDLFGGLYGPKDEAAAITTADKACTLGTDNGCLAKGMFLFKAAPPLRAVTAAITILEPYCDKDVAVACATLGAAYEAMGTSAETAASALTAYDEACELSHAESCLRAAGILEGPFGGPDKLAEAKSFYQKACDGGVGEGCAALATMLLEGGTEPAGAAQEAEALELFETGCTASKTGAACRALALHLLAKEGLDAAVAPMEIACTKQDALACLHLVEWGRTLPEQGSTTEADLTVLASACDHGYGSACGTLARLSLVGERLPKDLVRAEGFFRRSCALGDAPWCRAYTEELAEGTFGAVGGDTLAPWLTIACVGGSKDACKELEGLGAPLPTVLEDELLLSLEAACETGNPVACRKLGAKYHDGSDVPADDAMGTKLSQKACDLLDAFGCAELGDQAYQAKQYQESLAAYEKACALGYPAACTTIGLRYLEGDGVTKDASTALSFFEGACSGGHGGGCEQTFLLLFSGSLGEIPQEELQAAAEQGCVRGSGPMCLALADLLADTALESGQEPLLAELVQKACVLDHSLCEAGGERYASLVETLPGALDKAVDLYHLGCIQGALTACTGEASALQALGRPAHALAVLAETCKKKGATACLDLGMLYQTGQDVVGDVDKAIGAFGDACELGLVAGCQEAANLLAQGTMDEAAKAKVEALRVKACALGFQPACDQ